MSESEYAGFQAALNKEGKLAFTCRGVSMMPLLRPNRDVIVIEKKTVERCKRLDVVLFQRHGGQYVLHRVLKVYKNGYWIVGDNCVSGEDVPEERVLAVMTVVKRGKHTIYPTNKYYRIYAHLWGDLYPLRFGFLKLKSLAYRFIRPIKKKVFG